MWLLYYFMMFYEHDLENNIIAFGFWTLCGREHHAFPTCFELYEDKETPMKMLQDHWILWLLWGNLQDP